MRTLAIAAHPDDIEFMMAGTLLRLKDAGCEIINLAPEERAKWAKALLPIRESWLKEMESKKLPAKEVLDSVLWLEGKYPK